MAKFEGQQPISRVNASTPWKLKKQHEPKNGGLEDDVPFELGDF